MKQISVTIFIGMLVFVSLVFIGGTSSLHADVPVTAVNSGGAQSGSFLADGNVTGGTAAAYNVTVDTTNVTRPAPASVYQSERWGAFTYAFSNLSPGNWYVVRLHFAEVYFTNANQRVFNVNINGTPALTNFDIVATVGGPGKAMVKEFLVPADTNGSISIQYVKGTTDYPKSSGIEIVAPSPRQFAAINCGGNATSSFTADASFSGGTADTYANPIDLSGATPAGPVDLYQSERWGTFTYTILNLSPGTNHLLRLHFAEVVYTSAGAREFNVAVNGTPVLRDYDIVADAGGPNKAVVKEFPVIPDSAGTVTIDFTAGTIGQPKCSGIEVLSAPAPVLAINSGGAASGRYGVDANFSAGTAATYTNTIDTSGVYQPAPAAVYQSERWGVFSYTIPNLTPGDWYRVRLHFAEVYFTSAGKRLFNVDVSGRRVLTNFDIFAAAGTVNKAVVREFNAPADSSGNLVINFSQGTADQPKVSGIEIQTGVLAPDVLALNSGGVAIAPFQADTDVSGGDVVTYSKNIDLSGVDHPAPFGVYQSERWGTFTYTIPNLSVNMPYTVRLHFAEIYFTSSGKRLFNVAINGSTVLSNFDIVAAAGAANKAIVKSFTANADSNGQITIAYTPGSADQPKSSGIEVAPGYAATTSSPTPVTGPSLTIMPGREFSATSWVHQKLADDAALDPNSATYVLEVVDQINRYYGTAAVNVTQYTPCIFVVPANQPTVAVKPYDPNDGTWTFAPLADKWSAVPLPSNFQPASGTDKEAVVYQPSTGKLWEFWLCNKTGAKTTNSAGQLVDQWGARWGGRIDNIANNPGYFLTEGGDWNTAGGIKYGVTATSISFLAGIMTIQEQQNGVIDHAVGLALVETLPGRWSYPANRTDGWTPNPNPLAVPEGAIFRLPASLNLDAMDMDPYARMIAKAVQKHGMVIWDKAGAVSFRAENPGPNYSVSPYTSAGGILACPNGVSQPSCWANSQGRLRGFPWDKLQVLKMRWNQ